jgi:hypothetical protein
MKWRAHKNEMTLQKVKEIQYNNGDANHTHIFEIYKMKALLKN